MGAFFPLFLFLFLAGCVATAKLLLWYKNKEQMDVRELDLRVLAAEHNLSFQSTIDGFATMLRQNYLGLLLSSIYVKNIVSVHQSNDTVHFFDYSHLKDSKSKDASPYSAILIEFHNQTVPTFKITKKASLDWTRYAYIDHSRLPNWMPTSLTVIAHEDQQAATCKFLHDNPAIRELVAQSAFHKAYFRGRYMIQYYDEMYGASPAGFNWMLRRADNMRGLKGIASRAAIVEDVEINLLKQTG